MAEGIKIYDKSTGEIDDFSTVHFDDGLARLQKFSMKIETITNKKKKRTTKNYIIEIHTYNGFAFVKYYPRHLKDDPFKYKRRSKDLGYHVSQSQIKKLFKECALRMKDYLDLEPNNIVGYVGQPDQVDDEHARKRAQRSKIYNTYCTSVFPSMKYKFISNEIFGEFNIRLIRKNHSPGKEGEEELNEIQEENYGELLQHFLKNLSGVLDEFMTEKARLNLIATIEKHLTQSSSQKS